MFHTGCVPHAARPAMHCLLFIAKRGAVLGALLGNLAAKVQNSLQITKFGIDKFRLPFA